MNVKFPPMPIVLVDDEPNFLFSLAITLKSNGFTNVIECSDSRELLPLLKNYHAAMVLLDINMPHINGIELLSTIHETYPELPVINLTAIDDVTIAVECMRRGAFDYVMKPVEETRLITIISKALDFFQIKNENSQLSHYFFSSNLKNPQNFDHITGESEQMLSIFRYIEAIANSQQPVLITGETGTGKELIAQAVHNASNLQGEFIAINMAGLDEHYFSDTLFGHDKGAFTGADKPRKGLIETASNGTLFLDEIGDMSPELQVKLLRMLQERQYYPLGSDKPRAVKARIIAATNRDLESMQKEGNFRKDLYYRLLTHKITILPLRERMDDVPLLVDFFLGKASGVMGKKKPTAPRELYSLLNTYNFPGNVRELESMVFDAVSRHQSGILSLQSFREKIFRESEMKSENFTATLENIFFPEKLPTLKEMEEMLIDEAFKRSGGNQSLAAELLGLSRRALNNRLMRKK